MAKNKIGRVKERGFISLIVTLVAIFLLLSAFNVNIRGYLDASPEQALESNVVLIKETGIVMWQDYIRKPLVLIWSDYVIPFAKGDFLSGLKSKVEQGTTLPAE